jgi:hypothetical protein
MKSFIIIVLLVALGAAAYFTRPSKEQFADYIVQQSTKGDTNVFSAGWDKMRAESFVDGIDFKDRLLWVDVQQNGQTIYTGAFSHWFNRATVQADIDSAKQKAQAVETSVSQSVATVKDH